MADQNDSTEQDAVAAEWGRALDASTPASAEMSPSAAAAEESTRILPGGSKGGTERVLSQEEIDSLLGFSLSDISLSDNSGIRAIIDSAMVSYERLPMLEIVFDRLVRLMTTSLRNFTSDNVEVSL